jgi:hypothetical protein
MHALRSVPSQAGWHLPTPAQAAGREPNTLIKLNVVFCALDFALSETLSSAEMVDKSTSTNKTVRKVLLGKKNKCVPHLIGIVTNHSSCLPSSMAEHK